MKPPPAISSYGDFSFFGWKHSDGFTVREEENIVTVGTMTQSHLKDEEMIDLSYKPSSQLVKKKNLTNHFHCFCACAPLNVGPARSISLASSREAGT
ncbi:hypothetical protein C4D60_Mb07t18200 [Musa balbisiana]|uniref:Uncharacterized protein n=1 Tax=Musa balbisiana TaxID=52838 RepID=A0A4S8JGW1_MUSBA|nr:hypothetical protein C4D60_Mb07t18200 [Musa balbisiana]